PLTAIAVFFVYIIRKRHHTKALKITVFGLLFFLVNIFLLLRWFPSDSPFHTFVMADRYTYIASAGIFIAAAWFVVRLSEQGTLIKITVLACIAVYITTLGILTFSRTKVWRDSETLWSDVIDKYPGVEWAWEKRGSAYLDKGDTGAAVRDFSHIVNLRPELYFPYWLRANARFRAGEYELALPDINKAIKLGPPAGTVHSNEYMERDFAVIWYQYGICCMKTGNEKDGESALKIAAELGHKEAADEILKKKKE
ncbi:MAG: hypothetical protein KJ607_07070, partial [Bacteroidetes bacterium]|nr:hypothetical protein [Bacteroidota bacterium]